MCALFGLVGTFIHKAALICDFIATQRCWVLSHGMINMSNHEFQTTTTKEHSWNRQSDWKWKVDWMSSAPHSGSMLKQHPRQTSRAQVLLDFLSNWQFSAAAKGNLSLQLDSYERDCCGYWQSDQGLLELFDNSSPTGQSFWKLLRCLVAMFQMNKYDVIYFTTDKVCHRTQQNQQIFLVSQTFQSRTKAKGEDQGKAKAKKVTDAENLTELKPTTWSVPKRDTDSAGITFLIVSLGPH